jgi:transcriptional regulator with GAF, ATPase, and Fis domain
VRVIAATNRNLEDDIEKGMFRGDLYYRLNVFPLVIPPLRDRENDIELLSEFFIDMFAARLKKNLNPLSAELKERLNTYPWPGNVRELQNVIERAVISAKNSELNLSRILPNSTQPQSVGETSTPGSPAIRTAQEMQEFERGNITRALEATGWRISGANGAAKMLGMNASTLASKIKSLNITKP